MLCKSQTWAQHILGKNPFRMSGNDEQWFTLATVHNAHALGVIYTRTSVLNQFPGINWIKKGWKLLTCTLLEIRYLFGIFSTTGRLSHSNYRHQMEFSLKGCDPKYRSPDKTVSAVKPNPRILPSRLPIYLGSNGNLFCQYHISNLMDPWIIYVMCVKADILQFHSLAVCDASSSVC